MGGPGSRSMGPCMGIWGIRGPPPMKGMPRGPPLFTPRLIATLERSSQLISDQFHQRETPISSATWRKYKEIHSNLGR